MTDWDAVRGEFPFFERRIFLDAACVSLLPQRSARAVHEFTEGLVDVAARDATEHHIWMDQLREQALPQAARLMDVPQRNIALVESTTQGLNIAAQAIPWQSGDEVLMCDLEFLQVAIPFVKRAEEGDIKTVFVSHEQGAADLDVFRQGITPRTRAIVVSSTQWSTGYRIDLGGLAELAHSAGAWLIVDGIQQLGAVPVPVEGVDFMAVGGHKWLNSPMGTGFLYMSDRAIQELNPTSWGYLSLETPEGGWGNYFTTPEITPDREYPFLDSARRFETGGTSNYPGAISLAGSLELINEIGPHEAAQRVWSLGDRLIEGLRELPVKLETPFGPENRAGIITFSCGSRAQDKACVDLMLESGIFVGQRYTSNAGGVRVSVHFFNNEDDIDAVLATTGSFCDRSV